MTCIVPQNQPLYQALLDKAASYPPDKHYNAKAYKDAAEELLTFTHDVYEDSHFMYLYGIGDSIREFIRNFISNKKQSTKKALSNPPKPVKNNTQQVNSVTVELNISGKPLKLTFNSDDKSEKSLKGVNIECESTDVLIEFISEILDSANITPGMLMQYL